VITKRIIAGVSLAALLATLSVPSVGQVRPKLDVVRIEPIQAFIDNPASRTGAARSLSGFAQIQLERSLNGDTAARKELLIARRAAALTLHDWEAVISLTTAIRKLEPKAAMQSVEGLVFEAVARASRRGYSSRKFAVALSEQLARLDGAIVASSLRSLRTSYYLMSRNSVLARLHGPIAAQAAARHNRADLRLASELLEQLFVLQRVVPELELIDELLARRLAATDMQVRDLWSPRQVVLSSTLPLAKVVVGIWDSGVDLALFKGRLWVNTREQQNGLDDDGNGFVDDNNGFAFDSDRRPSTGALGARPGRDSVEYDRLARYSVGWADLDAGETTDDAKFARAIARSLSAKERAEFNLDLDRLSFFTHGTGIASIAASGVPSVELMIGRLDYRIGQVPPPIDEADAAARVAYADKAVAYYKANGARIVNMSFRLTLPNVESSLASIEPDPVRRRERATIIYTRLHEGFEKAIRSAPEILFVAGAGNSNENNDVVRSFPAGVNADNLIVVGAVDSQLLPASISSYGASVDVYALGVSVPQKLVGGRTIRFTGTSSATPQVTNFAAKLLALCPALTVASLRKVIMETSTNEGPQRLRVINPRAGVARLSSCS